MDITRNWRLKTSRVQLLATRCPVTGAVMLPKSSAIPAQPIELYRFEANEQPQFSESDEYARAAR